jgi:Heavy-metal-associated domain
VRVSLKAVSGVDSVDVNLEKGLAVVKLKPGNTATLKQLNEAIAKNGFTMKDSTATVVGTVTSTDGNAMLSVSGSNDMLQLVPESASSLNANSMIGKTVLVEGTIPEAGKGKAPVSLRYQSITEEKPK